MQYLRINWPLISIYTFLLLIFHCTPKYHLRSNINKEELNYHSTFKNGIAIVSHQGKWDLINKNKKFLTARSFDSITSSQGGMYGVCSFNSHGERKWGFIDSNGKLKVDLKYNSVSNHYNKGYAYVSFYKEKDYVKGTSNELVYNIIDKSGKKLLNNNYRKIKYLDGNYLAVSNHKYKWSLFKYDEAFKTDFKYDNIKFLKKGHFICELNLNKGVIDKGGVEITPIKYKGIKADKKVKVLPWHSIEVRDTLNQLLTKFKGDSAFFLNNDKMIVFKNEKPLKYTINGEFNGKAGLKQVENAHNFSFKNKMKVTLDNNKFKYIKASECNKDIEKQLSTKVTRKYDKIYPFQNKMAAVKKGDNYGFINYYGGLHISTQYEDVQFFYEDLAAVKLNGKWGFVNKKERFVVQPHYDWVSNFNSGIAVVKRKGKYGFVNKEGEVISDLVYDSVYISDYDNYIIKRRKKYGMVNKKGIETVNPIYKKIEDLGGHKLKVRAVYNKTGVVDYNNKKIIDLSWDAVIYAREYNWFICMDTKKWQKANLSSG